MNQDVFIRPARPEDLGAVGELGAELVRRHHEYDRARFLEPPKDVARGYGRFLGSQLEETDAVVLVAERAGKVVGYAYAGLEPESWMELRGPAGFLHDVVVAEAERKRGIAGLLIEAAVSWLEERGAPRVLLWTAEKNQPAQRVFARLGFRRTMIEMTRERPDGEDSRD